MTRVEREAVAICKDAGLTIVEVRSGGKHLKIRCAQGMVVCPKSPSDHRWRKNLLSIARRYANDR